MKNKQKNDNHRPKKSKIFTNSPDYWERLSKIMTKEQLETFKNKVKEPPKSQPLKQLEISFELDG